MKDDKINIEINDEEISDEIKDQIKDAEDIKYEDNFRIFELLDEKSFLESGYKQIQEKVSTMEKEFGEIFLTYPIPKAIIEEWEKVSKVKN